MTITDETTTAHRTGKRPLSAVEHLVAGEVPCEVLFPYPTLDAAEAGRVRTLIRDLQEFAPQAIDPRAIEERKWIGDEVVRGLGERGLMGLGVPVEYGGQGLSMLGWSHVFEAFGEIDPTLALVLGIHQAIGTRGIVMFGSDEQKERFLPDLAAARRLAAFALTEPGAGSDVAALSTRAVRLADGSWRLDGEKRYIGNGEKGDVLVVFARCEGVARDGLVAVIVEKGMPGFEPGPRYEMMGLCGNDVRPLSFRGVRIPPENVLGEPGDGFRIATKILEVGRMTLAPGDVGCVKRLCERIVAHVQERRQFGKPLAAFEMVQEKVAWIVARCFAVEAMAYVTAGLADRATTSCAIETALCKVTASDFMVGAANRAFDLRGGEAYMRSEPYEKILRDARIAPLFEGSNDVLRAFVALKALTSLAGVALDGPAARSALAGQSNSVPAPFALRPELDALEDAVARLSESARDLLVTRTQSVRKRQLQQKRLATALGEAYAQAAMISRARHIETHERDAEAAAAQLVLARTTCGRSSNALDAALDEIERDDDECTATLAGLAYSGRAHRLVADQLGLK